MQIYYFPYLFLNQADFIKYDNITVWNFEICKKKQIRDDKLRAYVSSLLAANRRLNKKIEDLGVVALSGRNNFEPLDPKDSEEVSDFSKVLFLTTVAKSNTINNPHCMATSENFGIVCQNFDLESKNTAYTSGKIVTTTSGGWKIGEIKYEMPHYVPTGPFKLDEDFLKVMQRLKIRKTKLYRLILRATDSMMQGYSNADDKSYSSRILEQCRAFEILFALPQKDQRKIFKKKIKEYCSSEGDWKVRYMSERPKENKWETDVRQAMWADKFYTLRNHIIHGRKIKATEFQFLSQKHWDLGLMFFLVSVKQLINKALGKKIFYDKIKFKDRAFEYNQGHLLRALEEVKRKLRPLLSG